MTAATLLADRTLLRVAGDDPRGFLQGLVTHDTGQLAPDRPLWAGLLTPQGKALFDFVLWDGGEGAVLIDCEAAQAGALARRLAIYRLRRAVEIAAVPGAVHWSRDGAHGVADPRLAALGRRWLGEEAAPATDWVAHRLALGVAEGVAEFGSGETLWLECNADLLDGVSFAKGCYVGQENTARMHHRARVARRLAVVPLDDSGDRVRARHDALGLAIALRRVEDWGDAHRPAWLAPALAAASG